MLSGSDINPFDSQETKPYQNDPRISTMTNLVNAYQREDIHEYEKILQDNKDLLQDPFIAENIDEVTRNVRTKAVVKLVAPYTRFTLAFISKQLKISLPEVQEIVGFLIVDKRLRGKINQQNGTVEIESSTDMDRVQAMQDWSAAIGSLWESVLNESDGFKSDESGAQYTPGGPSGSGLGWSQGAMGGKPGRMKGKGGLNGRIPGVSSKV
jgi:COP9 signalosome complex subunit 2